MAESKIVLKKFRVNNRYRFVHVPIWAEYILVNDRKKVKVVPSAVMENDHWITYGYCACDVTQQIKPYTPWKKSLRRLYGTRGPSYFNMRDLRY